MVDAAYDKTGRQIMVGDVLKVYHFTGARWRKRYFMYKQVVGHRPARDSGCGFLVISHLNMKTPDERDGGYWIAQDGKVLSDTEIVQGIDWHHDRPRLAASRLSGRENGDG